MFIRWHQGVFQEVGRITLNACGTGRPNDPIVHDLQVFVLLLLAAHDLTSRISNYKLVRWNTVIVSAIH